MGHLVLNSYVNRKCKANVMLCCVASYWYHPFYELILNLVKTFHELWYGWITLKTRTQCRCRSWRKVDHVWVCQWMSLFLVYWHCPLKPFILLRKEDWKRILPHFIHAYFHVEKRHHLSVIFEWSSSDLENVPLCVMFWIFKNKMF